jgi:hypothetical protein
MTVEKDEEYEQYLSSLIIGRREEQSGYYEVKYKELYRVLDSVSSFSAKRSREKAIEECVAAIKSDFSETESQLSDSKGIGGVVKTAASVAIEIAIEAVKKLKS